MPTDAVALAERINSLHTPTPKGFAAWRIAIVDKVKRRAMQRLHRSAAGEVLLLKLYFFAESATVETLVHDFKNLQLPEWLRAMQQQHLKDEGRHIQRFGHALRERGAPLPTFAGLDPISRHKVKLWQGLAEQYRHQFSQGVLVPAYAVGLCAEQMALRVLQRHCAVLAPEHALYPLLNEVLQDEQRHVALCAEALQRLTPAEEWPKLLTLLQAIRRIDAAWGITSAMALYALSWVIHLRTCVQRILPSSAHG